MNIKELLKNLKFDSLACEYCDVRVEETHETIIRINNREVTTAIAQSSLGAFLRVRKNGQWYYLATTDLNTLQEQLQRLTESVEITANKWKTIPENNGTFEKISYKDSNPTLIPLAEKVELLKKYDLLTQSNSYVKTSNSIYKDLYRIKTFINSVGTFFQYDFAQCGAYNTYDLADGDNKYNDLVGYYGESFADLLNQEAKIKKAVETSTQFLHAELVAPGKYKLLLAPKITGVFVHESFGHMSEADSLIGDPKAKEAWNLGKKVAADFISIVDYGDHQGGSGYCPIDDEGFKARKNYLVKDGILSGRLHSYSTADEMNESPTGNARALNFEFEPIVRMTSTYIENGKTPLAELYKMAEGAILIEDFKYGTGGELFTIAPGRAYIIKDGKPQIPVRINVINGQLFETLLNIEAIGDNFTLKHTAIGGCGKDGQMPLPVSDGGPTILVKEMQVS